MASQSVTAVEAALARSRCALVSLGTDSAVGTGDKTRMVSLDAMKNIAIGAIVARLRRRPASAWHRPPTRNWLGRLQLPQRHGQQGPSPTMVLIRVTKRGPELHFLFIRWSADQNDVHPERTNCVLDQFTHGGAFCPDGRQVD